MDDLDHQALRTFQVERPRPVAMRPRRRIEGHPLALEIGRPGVDLGRFRQQKADMVEVRLARYRVRRVEGQIVPYDHGYQFLASAVEFE